MKIVLNSEFQKELFNKNKVIDYISDLIDYTFPTYDNLKIKVVDNVKEQDNILKEVEKKKNDAVNIQKEIYKTIKDNQNTGTLKSHLEDSNVIFGTAILEAGVEAGSVKENIKNIVLYGKVIDIDIRALTKDKTLISFKLLSKKNGIVCKIFIGTKIHFILDRIH